MNVDVTVLPPTQIDVYPVSGASVTVSANNNSSIIGIQDKIVQGVTQQWVSGNFTPLPKVYFDYSPSEIQPVPETGLYQIVMLDNPLSILNPAGPRPEGAKMMFKIRGVSNCELSFGGEFGALGVDIPTGVPAGKTTTIGFIYDGFLDKWGCIAAVTEA